jgi:hypothetical protein
LKPEKDKRGLYSDIQFGMDAATFSFTKRDSLRREYLKTFNTIYSVKIDTVDYKLDFIFARWKKKNFGFETYLGIKNLTEGKHILYVNRFIKKDSSAIKSVAKIPFWYYKD